MSLLKVEYLSYDQIARAADDFLEERSITEVPVDIERIIEYDLRLDIITIPGLFKNFDIDGFITGDFSAIYVDESIYTNRPNRYRFTLAHELGHYVLHKEILGQVPITSISEWKRYQANLSPNDRSTIEFQGYAFGGLLLVPRHHLQKHFDANLPEIQPLIKKAVRERIHRSNYLDYALEHLATILAPIFEVSVDVISRRIKKDNLHEDIP
ncbi:MAG: ImmA/IrrE family metallo-endopeptidase [Desulfomonilia bacterium]